MKRHALGRRSVRVSFVIETESGDTCDKILAPLCKVIHYFICWRFAINMEYIFTHEYLYPIQMLASNHAHLHMLSHAVK
jgi:hypothetical protein